MCMNTQEAFFLVLFFFIIRSIKACTFSKMVVKDPFFLNKLFSTQKFYSKEKQLQQRNGN